MKDRSLNRAKQLFVFILIGMMVLTSTCPAQAATSKISLSLSGKYAVIMDANSGKVLYSKNPKTKCRNASTTKLITAIVAKIYGKTLKCKVKVTEVEAETE